MHKQIFIEDHKICLLTWIAGWPEKQLLCAAVMSNKARSDLNIYTGIDENVILHTSLHPYVFCLDLVYRISTAKFLILMVFGRTLSQRAASRFHHVGRGDKPLWVINGPNHSAKWTTIIFPLFNKKFEEQRSTRKYKKELTLMNYIWTL